MPLASGPAGIEEEKFRARSILPSVVRIGAFLT
jgi:hypothetical protein